MNESQLTNYLKHHYSSETTKAYKREIKIYLSNYTSAENALYKDITAYVGLLRKRYKKPATLIRIVASIKVYYDYLCDAGIREDNPAKSVKLRDLNSRDIQLQDLFKTDELEQLLHRKERYRYLDYRNKVLISLLIYQGLQPREMEAMTLSDINLEEGTIYIKSTPKNNNRTLSLKANQILLFQTYITEIRNKLLQSTSKSPAVGGIGEALLLGIRGEAMKADDITKHVKRSFKGLYSGRKINAQTIRQSVITNLLKQGHDISIVQAFAGHKYPSATEKYRQSEVETLQAAVNKYHPVK